MLIPLGKNQYLTYVTREDWGAYRYRLKPPKLYAPVSWVRFAHTGTPACAHPADCGKMMRALQETYLDNGFWDIPHNFLVGGDGVLYEGRGWTFQPTLPPEYEHLQSDCVEIAYIGDYETDDPPWDMREIALNFVKYEVSKSRYISPTFRVIPYRKILSTEEKVSASSHF